MAPRNFKMSFQLIFGLFIIVLGLLYTMENIGLLYAHDILKYWPILIAFYGISKVVQSQTTGQKAWGVFWIFVGSFWFLDRLDIFYFNIWDFWPLILVALGLSLILRPSRHGHAFPGTTTVGDSNSTINAFALLGGFKRSNDSQDFRGGEATAIMGGCEIDLRNASIQQGEAVLHLMAVMGGVEIRVPEDWIVVMQGVPVLGGFEDKTHSPADSSKRLLVRGYSVMGGVEIKN